MKKQNESIKSLNISEINCLESYIWHLGVLSVSVNTLMALQERAESIGIFNDDENECSKTLKYQINRLFVCIDDLLRMTSSRTEMDWDDFKKSVIDAVKSNAKTKKTGKKSK